MKLHKAKHAKKASHRGAVRTGVLLAITAALAIVCVPAALAEVGGTVTKSVGASNAAPALVEKSEAVYATLSPAGVFENAYVVNRFDVETAGKVVDYGAYDVVSALTEDITLAQRGEEVSFEIGEGVFFYQGDMSSAVLPWNVALSYELDGVTVKPEDLAGKSGALKIRVTTSPNSGVNQAFYDSFMLQITFTLDGDKCSDIAAEGATIASAGADFTVAFTVLPGHDGDFTLAANVTDFSMAGAQIAALPYASVMEMPSTDGLESEMAQLTDAVSELEEGSSSLAEGASSLAEGASTLSAGTSQLDAGLTGLSQSSSSLRDGSAVFMDGLVATANGLSAGVAGVKSALEGSADELEASVAELMKLLPEDSAQYTEKDLVIKAQVEQISTQIYILRATAGTLDPQSQADGLGKLSAGLNSLSKGYSGQEGIHAGITQYTGGVDAISKNFTAISSGVASLATGVNQLAAGAQEYADGMETFDSEMASLPAQMRSRIDSMMADYDFPEFVPVSFASSQNNNVTAVQFIMTTQPIELPEEPEAEEAAAEEETIIDRFFNLFK